MRSPRNTKPADTRPPQGPPTLSSVPYDVAAGLERHRKLVAQGTSLPEWSEQLPPARRSRRSAKWHWWLTGALSIVAATFLSIPSAPPTQQRPTSEHVAQEQAGAVLVPGAAATERNPATGLPAPFAPGHRAAPTAPLAEQGRAASQVVGAAERTAAAAVQAQPNASKPHARPPGLERAAGVAARGKPSSPAPGGLPSAEAAREARAEAASQDDVMAGRASRSRPDPTVASPQDREEMQQLARAEQLLEAQPAATLRLVRAGEAQFPRGYFRQERRYLEVMALLALGQNDEAEARARWFLRDYPTGPYRKKIELARKRQLDLR